MRLVQFRLSLIGTLSFYGKVTCLTYVTVEVVTPSLLNVRKFGNVVFFPEMATEMVRVVRRWRIELFSGRTRKFIAILAFLHIVLIKMAESEYSR